MNESENDMVNSLNKKLKNNLNSQHDIQNKSISSFNSDPTPNSVSHPNYSKHADAYQRKFDARYLNQI